MLLRLIPSLIILCTASCAHQKVAELPLNQYSPASDSKVVGQIDGDRSSQLAVLVAFSGGGTRASALSYGVLKEMSETLIITEKGQRPLLDEIDIISSVSGGSFTAAYYGLHTDKIFTDFEEKFLRKNVEGELLLRGFNPVNWFKLASRHYGRSDLAADYYDKHIFNSATFADLQRQDAPLVIMNSTDLASGARIPFFKGTFDILCIDFDSYPVSRAVAASSAAPVILSPVALKSHAGDCGYQLSPWTKESLQQKELNERKIEAQLVTQYLDQEKRPWLHLVDGGISDNLGLRAFYNTLGILNNNNGTVPALLDASVRDIVIISVNAQADHHPHLALKRYAPSLEEIISSVTSEQMSRYSQDTIQIVRYEYENLANELSGPDNKVNFYFVEVSFDRLQDDKQRDYFNGIATNFDLSDQEVDRIIAVAGQLLSESPEFQALLRALAPQEADPA
ncbi:MAG: patatin-like phospholipase family protein [bacterium]